ncbi:MAG: efflux RND transporter periplasmic adaptor subunit [Candidatus Pacebacteria bacterium]|nr:efflux RND transporter periplasmic adaptor subunit [Candidatus Paceibacterota bacterium]
MPQTIKKIRGFVAAHKVWSVIIAVIILFIGYKIYGYFKGTSTQTSYVLSTVQKGTIVSSVTGSGQVSASSQIDLKAKTSGDIVSLPVSSGQEVKAGDLILQVDARDASIAFQNAKIALQKLTQPADTVALSQAQNALSDAKDSNQKATDDLSKAYADSLSILAGSFLDFSPTLTGIDNLLGQKILSDDAARTNGNTALDYRNKATAAYNLADTAIQQNTRDYRGINQNSSPASIETILEETYQTAKLIAETIKDTRNFVDYMALSSQRSSDFSGYQNTLSTYTSQMNTHVADLLSTENTITNSKDTITSSARTIQEKTAELTKLQNGADPLDIAAQRLDLQQKEYAYEDAFLRAPFDGVIAKLDVQKTDTITSGATIGTLITKQKIADISLNEVDVAHIKVGQKATLTFDAVDGLSISGEVVEVDLVGTVSQGVVTYNVKIGFDTQDDRVRSGMSASASIITDVVQDVLTVPNSAVKSQGNTSYVLMFNPPLTPATGTVISAVPPIQEPVEVGASNDTDTEITSGLKEGDQIVVRTITASAPTTSTAPNIFGATGAGGNRGAVGGIRTGGAGAGR